MIIISKHVYPFCREKIFQLYSVSRRTEQPLEEEDYVVVREKKDLQRLKSPISRTYSD